MIGRLEAGLRGVKRADETFDQFVRRTRDRWEQIAQLLHSRWDVPTWYTAEDIRQDILIAAWQYSWRHTADRSRMSVERFTVWNGMHAAIKVATKARLGRRPHRGEGHGVHSCYEIPVAVLSRDEYESTIDIAELASTPATQEDDVGRRLFFERQARKACGVERLVLCALARYGNADCAVSAIYDDEDTRWMLKIGCEEDAAALVQAAIEKSVRRAAMSAAIARQKRARVSAA